MDQPGSRIQARRLSDRAFGFGFAGLFAAIFLIGWVFFDSIFLWALVAAAAFALIAALKPVLLLPLNRVWALFASRLTRLVNFVLLLAAFAVVIVPFGLVMRIAGRDALDRRIARDRLSYWRQASGKIEKDSFRDMF